MNVGNGLSEPTVWRIGEVDIDAAADVLTRAFFQDDTFFTTCIPKPEIRQEHLPPFFAACLRYGCHFGHVFAAGREPGRIEAVGWWYRFPEDYFDSERTALVGFGEVARLLGAGSDAIERISGRIDDVMAKSLPQPRANLDQLGVDPDAQGRGLGSALVEHIVADARAQGLPVALWTDARRSVEFYEKNGFRVAGSGDHLSFEIDWWVMFRELD